MKYWYLIGQNIQHSRSPSLWNYAFEQQGLDIRYELLDVAETELGRVEEILHDPQTIGANVTMPYKAWAFARADERDNWSQLARTANVLHVADGRLVASNTDIQGIIATLQTHPHLDEVLIVGAGGVTRATLGALQHLGQGSVRVSCRDPQRFTELMDGFTGRQAHYVPWDERGGVAGQASLIVNATSLGMAMNPGNPLPDFTPAPQLRVLDAVYRDGDTELAQWCADKKVPYASGLRFLLAQGQALIPYFTAEQAVQEGIKTDVWHKLGNNLGTWKETL